MRERSGWLQCCHSNLQVAASDVEVGVVKRTEHSDSMKVNSRVKR